MTELKSTIESKKNPINQPERFDDLSKEDQDTLLNWIRVNFLPRKTINLKHSSYWLKEFFEASPNGFYITNGAFKGAMLKCGYSVKNRNDLNWHFNLSEKSPALHSR